ncbi:hypothetical protein [Mesorhizobium sp. M0139]|uniref:hypothetical protein n=1 Tax=Mesorhizobium sp. M0139 TaxID=2956892 RepID=UPI0033391B79
MDYEQDNAAAPVETGMPASGAEEKAEVSEARAALVKEWCEKVSDAKAHWKDVFKAMRESMDFCMYGSEKAWRKAGNYTVPILPRYINQTVSQLYARNPKSVFKRRQKLMYKLWDGRSDTLQAAMESAVVGDQTALALVQEVLAVRQQNLMLDRMGQTLQFLCDYYLGEQGRNYKQQIKAAVRRVKTCKVAWIKLGYQRMLEERPEVSAQINDATSKLASIQSALAGMAGDKLDEQSADAEKLRLNLEDLKRDQHIIAREGPVLDFPKADQIIVDPECTHLKSLTGANWIAHEFEMSPAKVKSIWKCDVGSNFTPYSKDGKAYKKGATADKKACCRVYQIFDKENLQELVVVEGYKDFAKEPATPVVYTERFWPVFPIVFNEVEHHEEIYPLSDAEQAKDIQNEYNRGRQGLREHRIAARPYWVEGVGMDDTQKAKLADHAAHEVVTLATLGTGQKIEDLLQRGPAAPIDPNLYELESHFTDLTRVIGFQEAQIGGVSGATATESSIAQQSQSSAQSDNVDDLDEVLTELVQAMAQVMLLNVDKQTVMEIVGDGAVWPDSPESREEAAKELYLEVEAGSSGRPNRAADLANLERAVPYVMQIPGIKPEALAKKYLPLLDIDVEDALADGMPSITAINAMMAKMGGAAGGPGAAGAAQTGNPATDPSSQGGQGGQNAPGTQRNEPGAQPAYTAPNAA